MLCDNSILGLCERGQIGIDPLPPEWAFQPASVDLTLGGQFRRLNAKPTGGYQELNLLPGDEIWLDPNECVLACTVERITLPDYLVARVEGKSTWGRHFLMVHSTAGFIDPGFHGQITLELKNLSPFPLRLPVGCFIAQISFSWLDSPATRPYGSPGLGSHYQGQTGATPPAAPPPPDLG